MSESEMANIAKDNPKMEMQFLTVFLFLLMVFITSNGVDTFSGNER